MHPIAFQFGSLTVTWYGVLVATGFMLGLWTASRRAQWAGFSAETVLDLGPWLIVGAVIGARTLYVIMFWREQFSGAPLLDVFKVWQGGLVYYGGLIGSSVACILFAFLKKAPLWRLADTMAPSVALGQVFGRIGCLMNGCCYGRATTLACGIRYPEGHETHPAGLPATAVYPTQILEAVLTLCLYLGLAWHFRRKHFSGQVFAFYLIGYGILRSIVEMFRGDYPREQLLMGGWITPAHVVSSLVLLVGVALLLLLPRGDIQSAAAPAAPEARKQPSQ